MTRRYTHHTVNDRHGVLDIQERIFYPMPSMATASEERKAILFAEFEDGLGARELVGINLTTRQPVMPTNEQNAAIARFFIQGIPGYEDV